MTLREKLKILVIPLAVIFIYLISYILWNFFHLPSEDQMISMVKELFSKYGLLIIFLGALIEGVLLLGNYFPGGFIIFLGVISAGRNISRVVEIIIFVCLAFFISYTINYFIGKHGWYKLLVKFGLTKILDSTKNKLGEKGMSVIFFSYWVPNLAAITSTSAGILKIPIQKFSIYSLTGIILWTSFWGIVVYILGQSALDILGPKFIFIMIIVWAGFTIYQKIKKTRARELPAKGVKS